MRIVIVNPYDPLPWESKRRGRYAMLADELAGRGHKVVWLTANFHHGTKSYRYWPSSQENIGIKIIPIRVPSYSKNICLRRVVSHRVYAQGLRKALDGLLQSGRIDVVVVSIPPIESARVSMNFCAETGSLGVVDMQDAWPEVLELAFPPFARRFARLVFWPFRRDVRLASELASCLVAVCPEYLRYLAGFRRHGGKVPQRVLPLGFDTRDPAPWCAEPIDYSTHPLIVSYIGNFGRFYDLETVVRAARRCAVRGIEFIFIGDGPTYERVTQLAKDLDLANVTFKGWTPFELAVPILRRSHVGLVPYTSDYPPNTPNKAFDYLFLGLPVVSSVTGSFERSLHLHGFGLQYEAGNPESLASALMTLDADRAMLREMGVKGLTYARENFDGRDIYEQYADFIEEERAARPIPRQLLQENSLWTRGSERAPVAGPQEQGL